MSTRIRYKETSPGLYVSVQSFLTRDGALLKASFSVPDKVVYLYPDVAYPQGVEPVFTSSYTSVHSAKLILKKQLKELGVVFTDEVRRKKET